MTLVKCPGCKKEFKGGRSLSTHQRHCPALVVKAKARFKSRQENVKKRLDVKLPRQSDMLEDSLLEARNDFHKRTNSFQPDLDPLTGGKRKLSPPHVC